MAQATITLKLEGNLTIGEIEQVAFGNAKVVLAPKARQRIEAVRDAAVSGLKADPDKRVYGLNTGFGSNYKYEVPEKDRAQLQKNLILSHCAGVGDAAPKDVVRATMLLRAASLARGRSVVRPEVIETLLEMLNADVTPAIPRHGSVSASGDLAPLSHIAAVVIGEGRVLMDDGRVVETAAFLKSTPAFKPIDELGMKEGLALNNGCQYSNAWGALATAKMRRLMDAAILNTALHVQAMRGSGRPFRADLHALRAHPGSVNVAKQVLAWLDGYDLKDVTTDEKYDFDQQIQDPYNLRCAAQILGPCLELIERAEATMTIEACSVTDNPIDLNDSENNYNLDLITSGGHFHGMPLAVDAYGLLQAAGIMARLSNLRCARIVDKHKNKGLGPQVRGSSPKPTESGLLIAEYTTAGLCNHIWGLAMPSHLMSLSTDSGQEDHVSMAANVAMRADEAADRLAELLAIEMAFAAQAETVRARPEERARAVKAAAEAKDRKYDEFAVSPNEPVELGKAAKKALKEIEKTFPLVTTDQELSWKTMDLAKKVLSGEIVNAARH